MTCVKLLSNCNSYKITKVRHNTYTGSGKVVGAVTYLFDMARILGRIFTVNDRLKHSRFVSKEQIDDKQRVVVNIECFISPYRS